MAETNTVTPPSDEKVPGKIVSSGIPVKMDVHVPVATVPVNNEGGDNDTPPATPPAATNGTPPATPPANTTTNNDTPPVVDLTDDQLKAYFDRIGVPYESIDKLKEKLTTPSTNAAPTEEEKEKTRIAKEQRIINEHLSRKGTVEQFTTFKNIITAEKKTLGLQKEVEDLVAAGFSQEDATEMANTRYFQLTDEQIEAIEDKDLKAKALKEREVGFKKLENKGDYLQKTAQSYLNILEKTLADQDAEKSKMEQHTSTVEDAIKKYQRKETIDLGKIDDQDISPIEFEYSDTALASAKELLIDAKKFDDNLFTNDGGVKVEFILPYLIKAFSFPEVAKKSYLIAQDRAVEHIKAKFSATPPPLNGSSGKKNGTGTPGKLVSAGDRQIFRPAAHK